MVITGATGSGEARVACALAAAACGAFRTTRYVRMPELMDGSAVSRDEGWLKAKCAYARCEPSAIDDLMPEPLEGREAGELLVLVEARHRRAR